MEAVQDHSILHARREYNVTENSKTKWRVLCKHSTEGTIVEWKHKAFQQSTGSYVPGFVFWAFKLCNDGFQFCRKIISVDDTHLYTKYKHKMLIAAAMDGNQQVIRGRRGMCLISDRHGGIIKAVREGPDFVSPHGVHRRLRVIKYYKTTNCGRISHARCSCLGNKKLLSMRSQNKVTLNSPHRLLPGTRMDMGSTPMLSKSPTENAHAASEINLTFLVLTFKKYAVHTILVLHQWLRIIMI
ncbi:hypothetical protein Sango_2113200 [Sesamum angolense]|uniref:Uncharacterized protein n=1 Tax=Sesamum angolense TaxID=2727404 RepID=A0AAE2BM79_9LAMI|nr:hypothetical protein Sango_2113200 [Sesamum angolense]